jgi:DNA-binding LytR/AlgR family response regulator
MDIQLADGDSFEIFNSVSIKSHVIFITAFDKYAIKAFKVNSVDYLLKPVKPEELESAINKFKSLSAKQDQQVYDLSKLIGNIRSEKKYQKRLLIKFGDTFKAIEIKDVAYFFTKNRATYLCTYDNVKYPIDETLDHLVEMLNPSDFHRINRQFIVCINSINKMVSYSKSRVKLELNPPTEDEIIVATDRSPDFKLWLKG